MGISSHVVLDGDVPLAVRVHRNAADPVERQPVVLVTGSWLTVKEQMADHYAAALAGRGFTAVTFDFAGFGASGGTLRQTELPGRKAANLTAVAQWARSLSLGERGGPAVLAVCAGAQYALRAIADGAPVRSFVSVAGWFHDATSVAGFYGGAAGVAERLGRASAAAETVLSGGRSAVVPAYAAGDETAGMFVEMDYYANRGRGAVPEWDNTMTELSWGHWLTFDGLAAASGVSVPCVFVHSDGAVFPDNVRAVAAAVRGPSRIVWGEGEQTDWYDRPERTTFALDAADEVLRAGTGTER